MRRAQVEDGIVLNVIIVDDESAPEWCADWPECQDAGPGWIYDGAAFSLPVEQQQSETSTAL